MRRFESLLRLQERVRHAEIFGSLPPRRPEISRGDDGFLEPPEAAKVMGVSERELVTLVGRGMLEERRGLVRPAVVSVMRVREA